jgi:hypothetical protein
MTKTELKETVVKIKKFGFLFAGWWVDFGDLDYIKSELRADLEDAISSGEANDVDGKLALDLIVSHCRQLEKDGYI